RPSGSTRSHPSITRPRISNGPAWGLRRSSSVSAGSQRSIRPPCPLALTAMLPPIRKARPPNMRFSVTPVSVPPARGYDWRDPRRRPYGGIIALRGAVRLVAPAAPAGEAAEQLDQRLDLGWAVALLEQRLDGGHVRAGRHPQLLLAGVGEHGVGDASVARAGGLVHEAPLAQAVEQAGHPRGRELETVG